MALVRLHLTRDSVAAGDDCDAPHDRREAVARDLHTPADLQSVLAEVAGGYLPGVAGPACWAAYSRLPLAILSSAWPAPKSVWLTDGDWDRLDLRGDVLHVHIVYLGTVDPDVAVEVVRRSFSALR